MKLESKYNIGDWVYFINESVITRRKVEDITYRQKEFFYLLIKSSTAPNEEYYIEIDENKLFKSIDDICLFYKDQFKGFPISDTQL